MQTHQIKVLDIDLEREKIAIHYRDDLGEFLGGTGVAAKLFAEAAPAATPPLHPDQVIVLANGPLSTIFPVVTKVVAVFRSPLTGGYGESHAGMRLALAMRGAGYQAIVIRGQARRPTYLAIGPNGVEFRNASALWGLGDSVGSILRRLVPGTGHRSTLKIGPAGEKGVSFASVSVDTYRHFGRLGLGAVFGAKNLKAVVVYGDRNEPIGDFKAYKAMYEQIYNQVLKTSVMKKYHDLGTPANVLNLHASGGLPIRNLQENVLAGVEGISGEAFAEESLMRQVACSGCPIGCIHIGLHRSRFGAEYEFESRFLSYDYELIFAVGSFLGITRQSQIYELIDRVEDLGLDVMSAGVCLGWVTEALARGVITEAETGTAVQFGETAGYLQVLDNMVLQPNDFYQVLARGVEKAAQKYGGLDFAMTLGGHEMAGYHTGPGHLLGQTVGMRHSHLDNGGYGIDQKSPNLSPEALVDKLVAEEKWRGVLTSLCICLFAREVYQPETVLSALAAVGIQFSREELDSLGEKIFRLRQELRLAMGFDPAQVRFAQRFFQTPSASGPIDPAAVQAMLAAYRRHLTR